MNFVTKLPVFTNSKGKTYDLTLIIVNKLIKIVYYELIKVTIDLFDRIKVIINTVVKQYNLSDLNISD